MRKIIILLAFVAVIPFYSSAQYLWDFGGSIGVSNYLGDIGGGFESGKGFLTDLEFSNSRWVIGGFARRKILPFLFAKGSFNYLRLSSKDSDSPNPGRNNRNLSFRNDIFEFSVQGDVAFYSIPNIGGGYNDLKIYGFLGAGVIAHFPQAELNGEWYSLRPLKTEGVDYSLFAFVFPMGIGADFSFMKKYRIGYEIGWRKTTTDYIDDASDKYATPEQMNNDPIAIALSNRTDELAVPVDEGTAANYAPGQKRGEPSNLDAYLITKVNISYIIRGKSSFYRSRFGSRFSKGKKRKFRARF